jgi:SAM-dependent methyltransferase
MPLNWMDISDVPFEAVLLLERVQLSWLPGWFAKEPAMRIALAANKTVAWFIQHKCPESTAWVSQEVCLGTDLIANQYLTPVQVRQAELVVLQSMMDLLVYALDPAVYDAQPFSRWDSRELSGLVDFNGKTVIDVGAGTGRLTFVAAPLAQSVFPVEPVGNLRDYIRARAAEQGLANVYPVDGLITRIPFPDAFSDVVMSGHVLGDFPPEEIAEMERVTRLGGMIIFCPAGCGTSTDLRDFMVGQGYQYSLYEEPGEGMVTKFWKVKEE